MRRSWRTSVAPKKTSGNIEVDPVSCGARLVIAKGRHQDCLWKQRLREFPYVEVVQLLPVGPARLRRLVWFWVDLPALPELWQTLKWMGRFRPALRAPAGGGSFAAGHPG
jgi:hypothetical protein